MSRNGYELFERIGSPKLVVAPMVDQSDLAYRMMTRKYGAQLVYTQMFNANSFVESTEYRTLNFTTCAEDRPLFVQFAGHEPEVMLQAAKLVEDVCDAVDINLGCPQAIAKRGRYGAYLMEELELLEEMVRTLSEGLKVPVTCKTRIYKDDFERSIRLCETLINAGASLLTIHGRSRDEKGHKVASADWQMIRRIKQHFVSRGVRVPIIANGGIETPQDVCACLEITGCDGVMSSEAILETPTLYAQVPQVTWTHEVLPNHLDIASEYLGFCISHPVWPFKAIRSHIYKYLHRYLCVFTHLRESAGVASTIEEMQQVVEQVRQLVDEHTQKELVLLGDCNSEQSIKDIHVRLFPESWYRRYRTSATGGDPVSEENARADAHTAVVNRCQRAVDCCKEEFWNEVNQQSEGLFEGLCMFE